jgi:hypothetical protein
VTLRNAAGEHLCGPVPATATIDGNVFTLDRFTVGDFVNLPYHILAGGSPGVGALQIAVGDLTASLSVVVTP